MSHWLLVYPRKLHDLARDLVVTMENICSPMGMQVMKPILVDLKDDRIETYSKNIRGFLSSHVSRERGWGGTQLPRPSKGLLGSW